MADATRPTGPGARSARTGAFLTTKQLLVGAGGLLGAAASVVALRSEWAKPRAALRAEVAYGPLHLPPGFVPEPVVVEPVRIYATRAAVESTVADYLRQTEILAKPGDAPLVQLGLTTRVLDAVDRALPPTSRPAAERPPAFGRFGGYWHVRVVNGGSQQAQHVVLGLPSAVYTCVRRVGAEPACGLASAHRDLGTIQPRDTVTVTAWTEYVAPAGLEVARIRLTHADGLGDVAPAAVDAPRPAGWRAVLAFLSSLAHFYGWILMGALALATLWRASLALRSGSPR